MKFADLKQTVLSLAKVKNSQALKRCYPMAQPLNLSFTASWETLLTQFQSATPPEPSPKPSLSELKATVFKVANVQTVRQLKKNFTSLNTLDFRYHSAWETACAELEPQAVEGSTFQEWVESPPEDYKELFEEIKTVSQALDQSLEKGKQLGAEAQEMADSMVMLAEEAQAEVDTMKQDIAAQQKIRQQADLN